MQSPAQVSFRGLEATHTLRDLIDERIAELERYHNNLTTVRVVVEKRHQRRAHGDPVHVHIDVGVPGEQVTVDRDPDRGERHTDAATAIRDAFSQARRRLQDRTRRTRGDVKQHEASDVARVLRLIAHEDHGFLLTPDGRELYFHRNAVVDDGFDALVEGDSVVCFEEEGEAGPQARIVRPAGPG